MKKLLPLLLVCLLLAGCRTNASYYFSSPEEAYQNGFEQPYEIITVIDSIEIDDEHIFWLALIDTPGEPHILEAITHVKGEEYRIIDRNHSTSLNSASSYSLKGESIAWQAEPLDEDLNTLVWVWADTETVSGGMREKYTCKDYVIEHGETSASITLVYYVIEMSN